MRVWETNTLKMRGKLGQGVGALKKGGLEPPYDLWLGFLMTTCYFFAYTQWAGKFHIPPA